jgi:hypothetical protein
MAQVFEEILSRARPYLIIGENEIIERFDPATEQRLKNVGIIEDQLKENLNNKARAIGLKVEE